MKPEGMSEARLAELEEMFHPDQGEGEYWQAPVVRELVAEVRRLRLALLDSEVRFSTWEMNARTRLAEGKTLLAEAKTPLVEEKLATALEALRDVYDHGESCEQSQIARAALKKIEGGDE